MGRASNIPQTSCSGPRSARCSVFKDRCASATGLVALSAWGRRGSPKRAKKYSTAEAACLGGGLQAAEASLPHLQHMPVKTIDLAVEGLCGQRLAVELDPALLQQT